MEGSPKTTKVVRQGAATTVFVMLDNGPRQWVLALLFTLAGLGLVAFGVVRTRLVLEQSGELSFPAVATVIFGFALLGKAYLSFPRRGAWTHQFVFDGEAVHCIDPHGVGTGMRERVDDLRVEPVGDRCSIAGAHGLTGQLLSCADAHAVIAELRAAASLTEEFDLPRTRLISTSATPGTDVSVLPRPGQTGVSASRSAYVPITVLLVALPTLVLAFATALGTWSDWTATSSLLLGLIVVGYALVIPFAIHLRRQQASHSATLLPQGVSFSDDALLIREDDRVVEIPFRALHAVDVQQIADDAPSRLAREHGIPASGLVIIHGTNEAIINQRRGTRTSVLRDLTPTDALHLRELILFERDRWRSQRDLTAEKGIE